MGEAYCRCSKKRGTQWGLGTRSIGGLYRHIFSSQGEERKRKVAQWRFCQSELPVSVFDFSLLLLCSSLKDDWQWPLWMTGIRLPPQIINFFLPVLFFRFTHHIIHTSTTHTRSDLPPLPAAAYPIWCKCLACYMVYFYFYILTISLLRTAVHRATSSAATE